MPASSVTTPLKPVDGGDKGIAQIKDSGDGGLPSLALPALQPHPREINSLVPESKKASIKVAVLGITGLKQSGRTGGEASPRGSGLQKGVPPSCCEWQGQIDAPLVS